MHHTQELAKFRTWREVKEYRVGCIFPQLLRAASSNKSHIDSWCWPIWSGQTLTAQHSQTSTKACLASSFKPLRHSAISRCRLPPVRSSQKRLPKFYSELGRCDSCVLRPLSLDFCNLLWRAIHLLWGKILTLSPLHPTKRPPADLTGHPVVDSISAGWGWTMAGNAGQHTG